MKTSLLVVVVGLLAGTASCGALAADNTADDAIAKLAAANTFLELTLGTVKDAAETSAVRALVKYGDRLSEDERLLNVTQPVFYELTRKVEFDVTDKGAFGGVNLRYGLKVYDVPFSMQTLPNGTRALASNSGGWMHIFPITLGVDADRNFKNRDVLLEAGYVPFKGSASLSCFKLGGNPALGLSGQLGHRTRDPATAVADEPTTLRRIKFEALANFRLGCFRSAAAASDTTAPQSLLGMFANDLADVQVMLEGRAWRDFALKASYHYAAWTVRVPTGKGVYMDFKREVGREAPNFAPGSQFGAYLTVQF